MNFFQKLRNRSGNTAVLETRKDVDLESLSAADKAVLRSKMLNSGTPIDVRELMQLYSVDELNQTAEDYYANAADWSGLLTKPFNCLAETPELLICFGHLLHGLKPVGGMDILEFGAGPGWASHALTQLGGKVIVSDVSATALKMTAARFERYPIATPHTPPRYSHFDGHRFDLPDQSVDRIVCIDALHHVPNLPEVLNEMGRVLRDGGVAAFAEPGPRHSWSAGAQYEMQHHQVVENDIVIEDIWRLAQDAGFRDLRLAVFGTQPFHVSIDGFNEFLSGGRTANQATTAMQHYMEHSRRLFFLSKGEARPHDSRSGQDLNASIQVTPSQKLHVAVGSKIKLTIQVKNTGKAYWLPASQGLGSVWLGMHLHGQENGQPNTKTGYFTQPLPIEATNGLMPGASVKFDIELDAMPTAGEYAMEFDLVAQQTTWFSACGSPMIKLAVVVG